MYVSGIQWISHSLGALQSTEVSITCAPWLVLQHWLLQKDSACYATFPFAKLTVSNLYSDKLICKCF